MGKNTNMSRKERMMVSQEFSQQYDREGEYTSLLTSSDGNIYYYNDVLREWCKDCVHWLGLGKGNCSQFCYHLPPDKFTERDIDMILIRDGKIQCD